MLENQKDDIKDLMGIFSLLEVKSQVKKLDWDIPEEELDILWKEVKKIKKPKSAKKSKSGVKIQKDSLHMLVKAVSMMNKISIKEVEEFDVKSDIELETELTDMYDRVLEVNNMLKLFIKDGI